MDEMNGGSDTALLPCPFCGSKAKLCGEMSARYGFYVMCMSHASTDCFAAMGEGYDPDAMPDHQYRDEESAAAAWNRRTPAAEITKGVAKS